jgi:cytoplasmic iron level regulating protein YaaA (DUF328/UPF0246 family)
MQRVVLISCVRQKLAHRAKARDLYVSTLFKLSLAFAQKLQPDAIFILSAKYGLVHADDEIDPYDLTLNTMPAAEVKAWAERVLRDLQVRTNVDTDRFTFLAGDKYRKYLQPHLRFVEVPMLGLPIGKQLQFLKRRLSE